MSLNISLIDEYAKWYANDIYANIVLKSMEFWCSVYSHHIQEKPVSYGLFLI